MDYLVNPKGTARYKILMSKNSTVSNLFYFISESIIN